MTLTVVMMNGGGRKKGDDNIGVSDICTIDSIFLDVPELSFNLDTEQFFTTLDVVRHVLLAPPPPKREYEFVMNDFKEGDGARSRTSSATESGAGSSGATRLNRGDSTGSSMSEGVKRRAQQRRESMYGSIEGIDEGDETKEETYRTKWDEVISHMGNIDVSGKKGRQKMREAVQLVLGELEERCFEAAQVRCISWGVGKGTWKINHVNKLDDVEVVFTGLKGAHDFKDDGSMVTSFDLENFFVRSYKPGPEVRVDEERSEGWSEATAKSLYHLPT